jgi:hypothetical protein
MTRRRPTITAWEWVAVLAWSMLIMGLTTLPYRQAARAAGPDRVFAGFLWGVDEGNVYLQWIRQASEGRILLWNQYTTKDQNPHFVNAFLLALGRVCAWMGAEPRDVFSAARLPCGIWCLVCVYLLAASLTPCRIARAATLGLASLSSGLGWIVLLLGRSGALPQALQLRPIDVAEGWQAQPEAIIFLCLLLNPLFSFSVGLVALAAREAARLFEGGGRGALTLGLLLLVLGNIHGYDVIPLYMALVAWGLVQVLSHRGQWGPVAGRTAAAVGISLPAPLWALYTARVDPAYAAKINTPTLTARPVDVAVGFGLVLVVAVFGAARAIAGCKGREGEAWRRLFPVVWLVCGAVAVYLPVAFQRKMMEGLAVALCVLGGQALGALVTGPTLRGIGREVRLAVVGAVIVATVPSNLLFIGEALRNTLTNNRTQLAVLAPPAYLGKDEVAGLRWLAAHTAEEDVVLSSSLTGSHIPAFAPCRTVIGHWAETLDFASLAGAVLHFYDPSVDPRERVALLRLWQPRYVWYGPQERALQEGNGRLVRDPLAGSGLPVAYRNDGVTIYSLR